MGLFDFLLGRSPSSEAKLQSELDRLFPDRKDHLGPAAGAGHKAKAAISAGDYDTAWRLLHEQKDHYLRHAKSYGMTARQTLALDGSVHESLAKVRRLEGKHNEALVHLLYCIKTSTRPTKAQIKSASVYFKKCQFDGVSEESLAEFLSPSVECLDFRAIENRVRAWRS